MTEQLSSLDVAFLCLENDSHPMHLGAVATFMPTRPVHPARIVALLCERVLEVPRLRQRARSSLRPFGGASWLDDPGFVPEDHVFGHHVRSRGDTDRFSALVSLLMAQPLDLSRPPWEIHVITGLTGGRFAVIVKLHHALCDGTKAVLLGLRLLDDLTISLPSTVDAEPVERAGITRTIVDLVSRPDQLVRSAVNSLRDIARQAAQTATIASAVLRSTRPPTRRSPVLTWSPRPRRIVMARLELDEVQRVRKVHGGTVNDVLLALVTGALRQWLSAHGSADEGSTLRALIPVSQRARSRGEVAGNQISGFLCELPVGVADAQARLATVRADMDRHKAAGPGCGPGALPLLADRLPPVLHRIAAPIAGKCAPLLFDALVTSVHLPKIALSLDGAELREMYPVAPVARGHSVGVALSAYKSGVHICLHTNQSWMWESKWLEAALRRELAALGTTAEKAVR
jgi:WS/DGAT/MGAT family acyltransferase